ncbi:hypothetical protein [Flavobacterium sp. ASW18X]|uniref:hypothetical protein n=1 Tax=Flavobacterium sp. ASW18X TaxID=2572595 RepID=UPI0010AE2C8A|nr:hypothetical protein [Flavobacterium sp. ASW18X]TKD62439.1 hypothetical protein FBT53_09390 [Flavobacterium sp. ASW18X]
MDYYNTLIGILLLIVSLSPFVWLSKMSNKNRKKLTLGLAAMATPIHATIVEKDILLDMAIGLEAHDKILFFIKNNEQRTIDLELYRKCEFYDTYINTKQGSKRIATINSLGLKLYAKAEGEPPLLLEFFNLNEKIQPNGEFDLAKKWSKLITEKL